MNITLRSETFAQDEGGAWLSEGEIKTSAACRFFYRENGSFSLSYDEKTTDFSASSRISYDAESRTLTLSRFGDTHYTAVFGGEVCDFVYTVTPFSFDARAETEELRVEVCKKGGTFTLSYLLTLNGVTRRISLEGEIA